MVLTGAGFTCNFGMLSAREFHNDLFRAAKNGGLTLELQHLLEERDEKGHFLNFEEIIGRLEDKESRDKVVDYVNKEIFGKFDQRFKSVRLAPPDSLIHASGQCGVEFLSLRAFFQWLANNGGMVFTLNQDTFLEHFLTAVLGEGFLNLPGLSLNTRNDIEISDLAQRNSENPNGSLIYYKLHGSYLGKNGSIKGKKQLLIIGKDKEKVISESTILQSYMEKFEKTLSSGRVKLLVIGYSFNDSHINEVLFKSLDKNSQLELHVLDRRSKEELIKGSELEGMANSFIKHLKSYYEGMLKDVFPLLSVGRDFWYKHIPFPPSAYKIPIPTSSLLTELDKYYCDLTFLQGH